MFSLRKTIADLTRHRARWNALMRGASRARTVDAGAAPIRLEETHGFGSNPGNLRMFTYVPRDLPANPALVVVLHGCTQTAAGYDLGAGWSTLADRYGFALLLPEQQQANNPKNCFNWFQTSDIQRDGGEALSIRQMVERVVIDRGIDHRRVFVTGLSAGGAMTSVMLACYPEIFAAGAIIAGLPYGAATNVQQAFESMFQSPPRAASEWGDLVRGAASHKGPWPRVSVWHGDADHTVVPGNAREILKQWTDVHGLPIAPSGQAMVDGHRRQAWVNAAGDELIESYTIAAMAHGTPLATGAADDQCGSAGPFLLEAGISSSYHIATFFGLTADHVASMPRETVTIVPEQLEPEVSRAGADAALPQPHVLEGEVLDPIDPGPKSAYGSHGPIDIGAVITNALKAAGLMKDR